MRYRSFSILQPSTYILLLALAGCGDAVSSGRNSALDSADLQSMTDQMAASLARDPEVQAEARSRGTLKVVVTKVVNQMTGEILPAGQAEAFTSRVRVLLSRQNNPHFTWIMNRDYFQFLRKREVEDLGPNPETTNPEYELTAVFSSLTKEDADRRSSYYLCTYELRKLDRTVLWGDKYEVKKIATKGYLD